MVKKRRKKNTKAYPQLTKEDNETAAGLEALGFQIEGIIGGVYHSASVKSEPDITLSRWQIYEGLSDSWGKQKRTRHFVGYCGEGRVSTPIKEFDKETMIGKTASGRTYHLKGEPAGNMDAGYVWGWFCEVNKLTEIKNVTEEYC